MTPAESESFDDARLKAAVQRVWGAERAPQALRAHVAALATSAGANGRDEATAPLRLIPAARVPARSRWSGVFAAPWSRYGLAAAAMVVLGFAIASQLDQPRRQIRPGATLAALPVSVTQGMVDRHEKCLKYHDHHRFTDIARNDFLSIGQRFHDRLGFRVLSAPLGEAGPTSLPVGGGVDEWEFQGAAVCPVDSYDCAHLVFRRKGKDGAVSLFSLPRHSCANIAGEWECEYHDPRHPMAGVIYDDGVHCVIGSSADGSLSFEEIRRLRDDLRRRMNFHPRRGIPSK
jgi:hypothetical protein